MSPMSLCVMTFVSIITVSDINMSCGLAENTIVTSNGICRFVA